MGTRNTVYQIQPNVERAKRARAKELKFNQSVTGKLALQVGTIIRPKNALLFPTNEMISIKWDHVLRVIHATSYIAG